MGTKHTILSGLLLLLLFSAAAPSVEGIAIGVNKATISLDDVLREGYAEEEFVVSTDSPVDVLGVVEVEGDIANWVTFRPENVTEGFTMSTEQQMPITVIVQPPADIANGNYEGSIRVLTGEIARGGDGQFGTSLRAAFRIAGIVGITGVEQRSCVLGGVRAISTEIDQPVDFLYTIKNTGNVRNQPTLSITIFDQLQEEVLIEDDFQTPGPVLPTTQQNFLTQYAQDLTPGQYWVRLDSEDCSGGSTVTFDVLERGGILDTGEFISLDAEPWNEVGDIIPITAVFRNTGDRTVSAKLKGTVMLGRKLVKVIDTDFYTTPASQVANIETFFNPDEPGQYEVKGRVYYNNKLTHERTAIINVAGRGAQGTVFPLLVLAGIIILLLLLIIRRRRRRY